MVSVSPAIGVLLAMRNAEMSRASSSVSLKFGMVAVVAPEAVERVTAALQSAGERVHRIGRIVARAGDAPGTRLLNTESQWPG